MESARGQHSMALFPRSSAKLPRQERLKSGFKNQIEGSLSCPAANTKASFLHDQLSQLSFAGLRPQGRACGLGQRSGNSDYRGSGVIHASNGIQVVLQTVAGHGFDDHDRAGVSSLLTLIHRRPSCAPKEMPRVPSDCCQAGRRLPTNLWSSGWRFRLRSAKSTYK